MARPSKYPPEFRARAVALVLKSRRPIKHVADELGLGSESLRQWVRQHEADHGQRTDRPTSVESEELRRLRKENADLKRTNEILKLASAYFAQELDPTRRRS
jgi:transposase